MNTNKKGFTLVELIVVMAILSILMAGIFALFKPVSKMHVDVSSTDKRYTAIQGINDFVEESVKFSTCTYVFENFDSLDGVKLKNSDGEKYIHERILKQFDVAPTDPDVDKYLSRINIIAMYNKGYTAKGDTWSTDPTPYTGRVYKVRGLNDTSYTTGKYFDREYLAFGKGFYGPYNYEFSTIANEGGLPTEQIKSKDKLLVLNTKMSDHTAADLGPEFTSRVQYLNSGKSSAGEFFYFNANDPSILTDTRIKFPASSKGNNIFIVYVNP